MLADAQAELEKLNQMPRKEELPQAEAKVLEAKADWENWEQQWSRGERLVTQNAMSEEEFMERKQQALASPRTVQQRRGRLRLAQSRCLGAR